MPINLKCVRCGSGFSVKPSHYNATAKTQFCSMVCYSAHRAEFGRPDLSKAYELVCEQCSGAYVVHRVRDRTGRRFCSPKCRAAWQVSLPYDEWRGKLSARKENRPRGARNPRFGKPPLHPGKALPYITRDGVSVKFRSSWELEVARYLDRHLIEWSYEPQRFALGDTTYVPDFYLVAQKCFWEVKGWFHDRAKAKIARFRELYPEQTVVVLTKSAFAIIARDNRKYAEHQA